MTTKTIIFVAIALSFFNTGYGQNNLYIPVTINSPLFIKNQIKEFQIGTKVNNYGLFFNLAGQYKRKVLTFSIQQNNGNIKFDPLNFNKYFNQGQETHLIQSYPRNIFYCELGLGYDFNISKQKLTFLTGIGHQFSQTITRYFLQLDWGNESKLINAGTTIRANYAIVENDHLITLEPVVQGKVKIKKIRIVNQFGYSIPIKKHHDYMKPILTLGLEYIL
jgi:hypothetical protein